MMWVVRHYRSSPKGLGLIHLYGICPRLKRGDIAILALFCLIVGSVVLLILRPSPSSESVSAAPGLGTSAPNPGGPLMIKGPLVTGRSEYLEPGMEYVYSIPSDQIPLCINIVSGRVHLFRSRPGPADLGYHAGTTNLWGGDYKLLPANLKGLSTGQPEIHIEVQVGGKYLSREERPIP